MIFKSFLSLATAFGLLFGGAAATDAIQDSQSGDLFHAMKAWTFQVQQQTQAQHTAEDALMLQSEIQQQTQNAACDPLTDPMCDPIQDQTRDQKRDQTCDPTLGVPCEPIQDQLQTQDQLHLHETDPQHLNGDCEPNLEPGPHGSGNGNKP